MPESLPDQTFTSYRGTEREECYLCGLPVGNSTSKQIVNGSVLTFCCPGCLAVFQILFNRPEGPPLNFRETALYRSCMESGLISNSTRTQAGRQNRETLPAEKSTKDSLVQELTLRIGGMWCPACSWLIEEVLRRTEGIREVTASFFSDIVRIRYLPQRLNPKEILLRISKLGYSPSLFEEESGESREKKRLLIRLGVSSILTMNTMMISFALYAGFFHELGQEGIRYLSYPLWFLSTPVLFLGGLPILRRAFTGLRYGKPSMDTLIALAALAAYFYSIVQLARGSLHLYFDTAAMLVTIVLLGRYIETRAREQVTSGLSELYGLVRQKVRLLTNGLERWVPPEAVIPGESFLVLAGEKAAIDGRIISGRAKVDESILTGESKPVTRGIGEEIMSGTHVLESELTLEATRVGSESSLRQTIALMEEALSRKNPFELLSDRLVQWFVPAVLVLAVGTALLLCLRGTPVDAALLRAVTVLVIACPCSLGIASPLAKVAAIGKARKRGILIRDPGALEKAKDLDLLVFDKTGTMTHGHFSLQEVTVNRVAIEEALLQVASVEVHSDHFLAREVLRKTREMGLEVKEAQCFQAFEGLGVKGIVKGREILIGNEQWMRINEMELPTDLEQKKRRLEPQGMTVVFFGWEGQALGTLVFGDSLKENAGKTVQELQKRGIEVWLVSGDGSETTRAVAERLGIRRFSGKALPKEKVEIIRRLQEEGHRVGMVGDGLNDAPALAQADVGFALGAGTRIGPEAPGITLTAEDPARIAEVLDISKMTMKTIRQNLLFAFVYNGLAIPLAVAGLLNPLIAVFAMFMSSLSVIGNSYKLSQESSPCADTVIDKTIPTEWVSPKPSSNGRAMT